MRRLTFTSLNCSGLTVLAIAAGAVGAAPAMAQTCESRWATHLPTARTQADMAFDSNRGRVVLFGGWDASVLKSDTWEYDGMSWRLVATTGPSARRGHKMVYDAIRRRTLLIGGVSAATPSQIETWAWDGATWRMIDGDGPTYAFNAANVATEMALSYDLSRGRVVMVLANGQTWERGVDGWTLAATTGPTARRGHAMCFDRQRGRTVLFGGMSGTTLQTDTWEWDGHDWANVSSPGPSARTESRMVYDSTNRRVLLYGGMIAGSVRTSETWVRSGGAWTRLAATGATATVNGAGVCAAFDSSHGRMVLLGGSVAPWTDIWTWNGTSWRQTVFGPPARAGAAVSYDTLHDVSMLFGGLASTRLNDTWMFDGANWAQMSPAASPAPRTDHAMAFDPVRARFVMFGGAGGSGALADTWEFDPVTVSWTSVSIVGSGPSARDRAAMVFDPVSGKVMLQGGSTGGGETWLFDGVARTWTRVATGGPTRAGHAIAYFPPANRVVLYGGSGAGTGQTAWAWDGATWSAYGGAGPGTAIEHTLTYDHRTQKLVLVGPSASDAAAWEFDGAAWRRLPFAAGSLRARNNHSAWFDAARGCICIFGGTVNPAPVRETWDYFGVAGPVPVAPPSWTVSCHQGTASFTVQVPTQVAGSPTIDSVGWLKNGVNVSTGMQQSGSNLATSTDATGTRHTLTINQVRAADEGEYQCVLTNSCGGVTVTNAARLSICEADYNCSGTGSGDGVTQDDLFAFLTGFFASDPRADINRNGSVDVQDIFDFLAAFFTGC